jgi:hypothetical protein
MRKTAGFTWTDYKTNTEFATELNITPVLDKILGYRRNWIRLVNRMPRYRLPRIIIIKNYTPKGRRNKGRPLKRLLDVRPERVHKWPNSVMVTVVAVAVAAAVVVVVVVN